VQLSDELARVRFLADEPDPTGRFSDDEITSHLNAARRDVSLAARFPEIQINGFTAVGLQEYAVSEDIIEVKRVYVAGVRTPRTDIATLEGEAIGLYDNAWQSAPLAFYPISTDLDCGYPAPTTMPVFTGMRSMWYPRGPSVVGLVSAPASVVPLRVEGIALAPDLVNAADIDVFPRFYLNTICWGAIGYMKFADSDTAGYQWAQTNMGAALGVLIDQIKSNNAPQGTRMLTYRSVWNVSNYGGGRRWR
jgi:hypothetical protein